MADSKSTETPKASSTEKTEPELATQPPEPDREDLPRDQIANISVKPEDKEPLVRPLVSAPMPHMVDDAQLAVNQAAMVSNTGETGPEGKKILLATEWLTTSFQPGEGDTSFPVITQNGTWVTKAEAEAAELAAHRSGVKLFRMEG